MFLRRLSYRNWSENVLARQAHVILGIRVVDKAAAQILDLAVRMNMGMVRSWEDYP